MPPFILIVYPSQDGYFRWTVQGIYQIEMEPAPEKRYFVRWQAIREGMLQMAKTLTEHYSREHDLISFESVPMPEDREEYREWYGTYQPSR